MDNFLNEFFGRKKKPEQSQPSGDTARPEISQPTGPAGPDLGKAEREKDPAREKEIEIKWDPRQRCLVVETEQVLKPESLERVRIKLAKGQIRIEETDEVGRPELIVTERIYAGSESEASNFYKQNRSGVDVEVDSDSLSVTEKSSSGVVSGGSGSVNVQGAGGVVIIGSDIGGNISNRVNGGTGSTVIIDGRQTGSSQSASRGETQVVLKVPVAENVEGKEPEPERAYFITVDSGHIGVENGTGRYTISAGSGNVVIKGCRMMAGSKIETGSGGIEVTGTTFNSCRIETGSGNVGVTGTTFNLCTIQTGSGNVGVTRTTFNLCTIQTGSGNVGVTGILDSFIIITGSGNVGVTGIFTGENTVKTGTGDISVGFDRGQGEIIVQTILGGRVIKEIIYFEGIKNPNGQTARLSLITQAGKIEVNE